MFRCFCAIAASILIAAPALAETYSAKPAAPASGRFITGNITWNCAAGACQGSTEESRPAVLCQSIAKRAGRIESFTAGGRAFTGAELEHCNVSAKGEKASSLAAQ